MDKHTAVMNELRRVFSDHTEIASLSHEVAAKMAHAAIAALEPVTVQEAARVLLDVVEQRAWTHYPIEMPITVDGLGPATIGKDAHCMTYEVWEANTLRGISSHDKLPDAIEDWLRALAEKP